MEAIRKAGGAEKAGLKNAKNRKKQRKAKKEEQAVSSGGAIKVAHSHLLCADVVLTEMCLGCRWIILIKCKCGWRLAG